MDKEFYVNYEELQNYTNEVNATLNNINEILKSIRKDQYSIFEGETLCFSGSKALNCYESIKNFWENSKYDNGESFNIGDITKCSEEIAMKYKEFLESCLEQYAEKDEESSKDISSSIE